jgi:hypothetical protein
VLRTQWPRHGNREVPREPGRFAPGRGGLGPAWGAEVVSSNIVGYEKVNLNKGFNMIGVQFVQVGGAVKDLATVGSLDDSFAGFDEDGYYATEMRVWTGTGYSYYGWTGTSGTDLLDEADLDNLWLDDNQEDAGEKLEASSGFWVNAEKAGTLTISGEVPSSDSVDVNLVAGFNMVANPYPGAVKIAQFGTLDSTFAGFDEDGYYATEMRVWTGTGYSYYGWTGTSGTDLLDEADLDNLWLNDNQEDDGKSIEFGHAVWINAEKAGKITFKNPATASGN